MGLPLPVRFPDPARARQDGLVAVGGDLSVATLLEGYRSGVFPWTTGPVTWWSPDPRGILEIDAVHVPRSLSRTIRSGRFEITFDRAFEAVIRACAAVPRREGRTWITPEFVNAYLALHQAGAAHSVESWRAGRLVGGVYGVAIGGCFSGESMFHLESDASKVALVSLAGRLRSHGFLLFDTQMVTAVTRSLGAVEIERSEFLRRLAVAVPAKCAF